MGTRSNIRYIVTARRMTPKQFWEHIATILSTDQFTTTAGPSSSPRSSSSSSGEKCDVVARYQSNTTWL